MTKLILPKKYLSYSAINSFLNYYPDFRKQYYEGAPFRMTPEVAFGSKYGKMIEKDHPATSHIKRYPVMEQRLECEIEGIPFLGYIDSFDPMDCAILEYKTGVKAWNDKRVADHLQLDIYSICVEQLFGKVQDECELVWIKTKKVELPKEGRVTHMDSHTIELHGKVKNFKRVITKDDREAAKAMIVEVAHAISEDYQEYLAGKESSKNRPMKGGRVAK